MEKLLELLNEFEKERKSGFTWRSIDSYDNCVYGVDCDGETEITMYSDLYSKQYGFIKWLVDNDKIDTQNLITYMNGTSLTFNKVPSTDCASIDKIWNNFYTECLLMLLSIQDNPIEFLISILK